jgi:hypothetical protein
MVMGPKKIPTKRKEVSIQEHLEYTQLKVKHSLQWNQHIQVDKSPLVSQLTERINGLKKISVNATFTTKVMVQS